MSGKPQGGLGARLLEFFAANPDEELTFADAAAKFGLSTKADRHNLSSTLTTLKARGVLDVQRVTVMRAPRGDAE